MNSARLTLTAVMPARGGMGPAGLKQWRVDQKYDGRLRWHVAPTQRTISPESMATEVSSEAPGATHDHPSTNLFHAPTSLAPLVLPPLTQRQPTQVVDGTSSRETGAIRWSRNSYLRAAFAR